MPDEHLIATTRQAPWLPPDSSAEFWAGDDCAVVVPAVIVRLLLSAALAPLLQDILGTSDVATRCVGYVRNLVPTPDDNYPHPTPWAHVPDRPLGTSCSAVMSSSMP